MPHAKRYFIEGYDPSNWGDVLMATSSASIVQAVDPTALVVFSRALPYDPVVQNTIFAATNISEDYGHKPSWLPFSKQKRPFEITASAKRARKGDVVVFCNGYIFGDPWPTRWIEKLANAFESLHKRGVKIILMPQSFGPFENADRIKIFEKIIHSSQIVFTRDGRSMDYLHHSGLRGLNVFEAIDYTGTLNFNPAFANLGKQENRLAIIPNVKIREKYGDDAAADYIQLLSSLSRRVIWDYGLDVSLIHHTAGKDEAMITGIASQIDADVSIVKLDPLATRQYIGESQLVVSSRFHGVMNALTQNVPVISLGWSHKYSEIMKLYGAQDYSIIGTDYAEVPKLLDTLISHRANIRETLHRANATLISQKLDRIKQQFSNAINN